MNQSPLRGRRIIELGICHIRGFAHGPHQDDLATNPVAEASTGVMDDHRVNGHPSRLGPSYHDQFAGAHAVIRILATLLGPAPRPEDRRIDIGLYETGLHLAGRDLAGLQLKPQLLGHPEREAGGEFAIPGYGAYETKDGRWIYLLLITDAHWRRLAVALSVPEGDSDDSETLGGRKKQRERAEASVRHAMACHRFDEVVKRLAA